LGGERPYDIDAVDWFLGQLAGQPNGSDLAGLRSGPWRDLEVAQLTRSGSGSPARQPEKPGKYLAERCANAWRDFGHHPGMALRWERVRTSALASRWEFELRTVDQQPIARLCCWPIYRSTTVSAGGRSFTINTPDIPARSTAGSWPPGIGELAARGWQDHAGYFTAATMTNWAQRDQARQVDELVDETGTPVLYTSGDSYNGRACARVTFPDQRWLRFLVRGTSYANAIMTAVDQAGNKVARYRAGRAPYAAEILVHPNRQLTDELTLAIAISPAWLRHYFDGH
jgi:hypothetical protein